MGGTICLPSLQKDASKLDCLSKIQLSGVHACNIVAIFSVAIVFTLFQSHEVLKRFHVVTEVCGESGEC